MRRVHILGVPMDLGANRRGVDMGPSALRYAGLQRSLEAMGLSVEDGGDIEVPGPERHRLVDPRARYLPAIGSCCRTLADRVADAAAAGAVPLILGGDHSVAMGSIAGMQRVYDRIGVVWLDAHADLNTPETTPSGNVHGMGLAAVLGAGPPSFLAAAGVGPASQHRLPIAADRVVLAGVREIDPGERQLIKEHNIRIATMQEVDRRGIAAVMSDLIALLKPRVRALHISLDLDVLDPKEAPGVGTPVPGGLSYRECHLVMEMLAETGMVASVEVVEVNPILDERNRTAEVAIQFIRSALGATLL